ncbi:P68 family surface lipoprotein [Mesomycoplasma neurolyticum]|uniref:Lipoprotein n=1 Tax=Mesomycoplasma neurolyticum TaxID=2120 RepID=A0A449A4R0_9BACT|nr:hypothetical protein [Mesomycoplasma neurolyticum]VEU59228.1 Uncharacterised protein [Mesomycoplasma neurolyticum]
MNKTIKKILFFLISFMVLITFISCNPTKNKTTIKFATAQYKNWPLTKAMTKIVEMYNKENKGTKDFIEIEYLLNDKTKTLRESELALKQVVNIYKDFNFPDLANIILNNPMGAFLINSKNRNMDLSDVGVGFENFPEEIAKLHSVVPGERVDSKRMYSIPFNISDTNALMFNLDLMFLIFNLIENNGGKVDKNSNIYKKSLIASQTGSEIPENSFFLTLKAKNKSAFKNISVNDETFQSYNSILNFVDIFFNGIEIDETKIKDETPETNAIFGINYPIDTFFQDYNNLSQNKKMWNLKPNPNDENTTYLNYDILEDKILQSNFEETTKKYINNIKYLESKKNKKNIFNKKYQIKNTRVGYELRDYRMAFGFGFVVTKEELVNTLEKKNELIKKQNLTEEQVKKILPTEEDLYFLPQVTKSNILDKKGSWWEGGSSIVAISVDNNGPLDKATKKFLKWLFNAKVNYRNKQYNVTDLIPILSGYFFPSKNNVSEKYSEFLKQEILDRQKLINSLKQNNNDFEIISELEKEKLNLEAALVSQISLLNAIRNKDNLIYKLVDKKASSISKTIERELRNSTIKSNVNNEFESEKFLNEILNKMKK